MPENNPIPPPVDAKELAAARRNSVFNWLIAIAAIAVFTLKFPVMAKGILIFVTTLSILVFVHEWGHFQFARWAGMKVNRFGIGFPPWVFTKRHKGIDYSIGALPIGGMVDIAGLGSEEEMVATSKGQDITTAPSHRDGKPETPFGERLFQDSSLGWRFMTLFAGPMMNFIFAMVLFVGLFSVWGAIEDVKTATTIGAVRPNTPADAAGLGVGDKIIGVNGTPIQESSELSQTIQDSDNRFTRFPVTASTPGALAGGAMRFESGSRKIEALKLSILRNGQTIEKTVTPTLQDLPIAINGRLDSIKAPAIGIEFDEVFVQKKVGVGQAVQEGFKISLGMTQQIVMLLTRAVTGNMTSEEVRSIGGPVKIAQATSKAARAGFYSACLTAAAISVNLGLMNLLPLPALDGGRILFLGYELVFRKPIDARKEGFVHMLGMALLLMFMIAITVRDVLPWITRGLKGVF